MKHPNTDHLKQDPFQTPEGYFEQLDGRIRRRISDAEPTYPWYRTAFRLAPVAIGLLLIGWLIIPSPTPDTAEEILAELSDEDIALYLEVHDALGAEDVLLPAEEETLITDVLSTDTL